MHTLHVIIYTGSDIIPIYTFILLFIGAHLLLYDLNPLLHLLFTPCGL